MFNWYDPGFFDNSGHSMFLGQVITWSSDQYVQIAEENDDSWKQNCEPSVHDGIVEKVGCNGEGAVHSKIRIGMGAEPQKWPVWEIQKNDTYPQDDHRYHCPLHTKQLVIIFVVKYAGIPETLIMRKMSVEKIRVEMKHWFESNFVISVESMTCRKSRD